MVSNRVQYFLIVLLYNSSDQFRICLNRATSVGWSSTWPTVMEQIMLHEGSNEFKIPQTKKQAMRSLTGSLPSSVPCSMEAVTCAELVLLELNQNSQA